MESAQTRISAPLILVRRVDHLIVADATAELDSLNLKLLLDDMREFLRNNSTVFVVLNLARASLPQSSSWSRIHEFAANWEGRLAVCAVPEFVATQLSTAGTLPAIPVWKNVADAVENWEEAKSVGESGPGETPDSEPASARHAAVEPPIPPAHAAWQSNGAAKGPAESATETADAVAATGVPSTVPLNRPLTRYHIDDNGSPMEPVTVRSIYVSATQQGPPYSRIAAIALPVAAVVAAAVWFYFFRNPGIEKALAETEQFYAEYQQIAKKDTPNGECAAFRDRLKERLSPTMERLAKRGQSRSPQETHLMQAIRCLFELAESGGGVSASGCEKRYEDHLRKAKQLE